MEKKHFSTKIPIKVREFFVMCLLIIPLFVFIQWRVLAQPQNARFEKITINDGLSQGSIRDIHQDKNGFLWFATQDGLNRYDGYSFKIFRKETYNPNSLSSNNIYCIDEDDEGNLWIGTADGLSKFSIKDRKFTTYSPNNDLQKSNYSNLILSIYISNKDKIVWFGSRQGLYELNTTTGKMNLYQTIDWNKTDGSINCILGFDNNTIFVGNSRGILYKFDKTIKTFTQIDYKSERKVIGHVGITSLIKDNENNIWIGTFHGLFKYNPDQKSYREFLPEAGNSNTIPGLSIMDIEFDKENNLWISVLNSGISKYDVKTDSFTNYSKETDEFKPENVISKLFVDKSGILWLGTNGYGILKLNPYLNNFTLYSKRKNNLSFQSIRSFYKDNIGNLWVGGYGGIDKINLTTGNYENIGDVSKNKNGFTNSSIYILEEDKDFPGKILWVGTEGGDLNKLDLQTGIVDRTPFKNLWRREDFGRGVFSLFDDGNGFLWVGTHRELVVVNKNDYSFRVFRNNPDDPKSISPQSITKIYKDSYGKIWIGTDLSGLCLFNEDENNFKHFSSDPLKKSTLSNNFVKCIYEDRQKRLWIGTNGGGLNLIVDREKGIFEHITTEEGLSNNVVYGILEDEKGNLWMSTNNGLCKYNPDDKTFSYFDSRDGLQSNEFNTNAFYKSKDGMMYFGGIEGFNSFNPDKFAVNNNYPNIVLTKFELFNKNVDIGEIVHDRIIFSNAIEFTKQIELDYSENIFSIEFASLDYASPLKNKYSYILEGFNSEWSPLSESRKVTYTNLHPGTYIFKVKGSNNDGIWSSKPAELTIVIIPPFWQTWWFVGLSILSVVFLAGLFYYKKINGIKEQKDLLEKEVSARTSDLASLNEELKKSEEELKELNLSKDKFFSILAHDMRGPFGAVIGLSEILVEDIDEMDKEAIKSMGNDINQLLHEQYILLENLLDWSRLQLNKYQFEPESINLSEIVNRMYRFLLNNAKAKNVNMTCNVPDGIYVTGNATMLLSVVQNLTSNAIKFTKENGSIKISLSVKGKNAVVIVEDSGVGMSKETIEKLFNSDILKSTEGTAKERGSGIGLMLVNEFVNRMNGTIKVESKINEGTKFIVQIPLSDETNLN